MSDSQHIDGIADKKLNLETVTSSMNINSTELCLISVLPDELLFEILEHISPNPRHVGLIRKLDFNVPLVCKRWQRVYERVLWRVICITKLDFQGSNLTKVLSLLESRPYLRKYPKTIQISVWIWYLGTDVTAGCITISSIINLCSEIDELVIRGPFSPKMEQVLSTCTSISHLKRIHLEGDSTSPVPTLRTISNHLTSSPSLKEISLSDYSYGSGGTNEFSSRPTHDIVITQDQLDALLPPTLYHTSSVTTMHLSHPLCLPNITYHILRWPTHLTHLSFSHYRRSPTAKYYTTQVIQGLLDIHASTLKHITLGRSFTPKEPETSKYTPPLDFSTFLALEKLQISAFDILSILPEIATRNLSAPKLHHVTLTFLNDNSLGPNYRSYFQQKESTWIQEFARCKKEQYPHSKLVVLEVIFHVYERPEDKRGIWRAMLRGDMKRACDWKGELRPVSWPWEYLQEAKERVEEFGLGVRFCANYEREVWDGIVRDAEVEIDEGNGDGDED